MFPSLVDVFKNDLRLEDGFTVVDKNRDLLMNRVESEKQRAFLLQHLFDVIVRYAFELQSHLDPTAKRARPIPQQLHFFFLRHQIEMLILVLVVAHFTSLCLFYSLI